VSSLPASILAVYLAAFKEVSEKSTGMITLCIVVGFVQGLNLQDLDEVRAID
jgi:hypothetical protein